MKRPHSALVRLNPTIAKGSFYNTPAGDNNPISIEDFVPINRMRVKKIGIKSQQFMKNAVEKEKLKEDIIHGKVLVNCFADQNRKLRTQIEKFKKEVNRYENVDEQLLSSSKLMGQKANTNDCSLIPTLKFRVRQQQVEIDQLKEQYLTQVKQMKLTKVNELEFQLTHYQEETERLKTMLQDVLELDEMDVYTQGRMFTCLNKIDTQKKEILSLMEVNKQYDKQINLQNLEIKKLQLNYQHCVTEKGNQNKKFQDQIKDIMAQLQIFQMKDEQSDAQLMKQEMDILKEKLLDKDNTILNYQDLLKQTKRDYQLKIHTYLTQIQQSQTLLVQKEDQMILIEQKIENYEAQNLITKDLEKKYLIQKNKIDVTTQFPLYRNKNITKEDVKQVSNKLRYQLRRKQIAQKEIPNYLFPEMNTNQSASFGVLRQALENFPFTLNLDESFLMASYLLQPEDQNLNDQNLVPLGVLSSRAMHMVPAFEVMNIQDESLMHTEITRKLLKQHNAIEELVSQIKKQEKCHLSKRICTQNQFQEASRLIYDIPFTNRQMDYISQVSFEKCGDSINIDLHHIFQSFNIIFIKSMEPGSSNLGFSSVVNYFTYYKESIIIPSRIRISSGIRDDNSLQPQNSYQSRHTLSPRRLLKYSEFVILDYFKPKKSTQQLNLNLQFHQISPAYYLPSVRVKSLSFFQLDNHYYVAELKIPTSLTDSQSENQNPSSNPPLIDIESHHTILGSLQESKGQVYLQSNNDSLIKANLLEEAKLRQQSLNLKNDESFEHLNSHHRITGLAKTTLNDIYQNAIEKSI